MSELFRHHFLPAHCSGGFAKAGIYPFDKRAISKDKIKTISQPISNDMSSQSHNRSLIDSANTADNNETLMHYENMASLSGNCNREFSSDEVQRRTCLIYSELHNQNDLCESSAQNNNSSFGKFTNEVFR